MRIRVEHSSVTRLAADMSDIPARAKRDMATTVAKHARAGNRRARTFARDTAGAHGKHYPKAFSAEKVGPLRWEYGPDAAMPQGGMSFEWGSRNQPPHMDLARSADVTGPLFAHDVANLPDRWFW